MRSPRPSSSSKCSSSSSSSYSLAAKSLSSRLLTVFKKAQELTTLCDIETCVIHYGPDGELKTWPEDRDKVRDLALRYIQLDKAKRRKKSVNLHEFLNKMKEKKTMLNKIKKRNVEELKYPISDHYSPDQINQLIHSLEIIYSTLQERRRILAAKKHNESLNPNQFTPLPQEYRLKNHEVCVYDQNNNNSFQHLCVSAAQKSGLHYQLMPYDQNMMCMELQESVSNYELNQLMPHEHFPYIYSTFCFDFQDPYSGFMVGNPSFPQDFNPDMSSSYVDENRLLQASTLPSL
ncbi:hypothetical protein BRARA_D01001 [Brassica rapa]|uniref:MADS-box domain-containing protein n=1 Tax=Brassica campestris TaxID=3711 RepID=A0A397ZJM8_BRACM|nr:hypothetical protein BRARA_D01001 [Brassica rapa]